MHIFVEPVTYDLLSKYVGPINFLNSLIKPTSVFPLFSTTDIHGPLDINSVSSSTQSVSSVSQNCSIAEDYSAGETESQIAGV